jgi:hypothetical protein
VSRVRTRGPISFGSAVLLSVLALLATLTGCGAGQVSQTASQASAVNGYSGRAGDVEVRNAAIAYAGQADNGAIYRAGQTAPLNMTLVNVGIAADRLVSVSSPVAAGGQIQGDGSIGAAQSITVGDSDSQADAAAQAARTINVTLVGLKQDIKAGLNYPVVLTFERGGVLNARLPIGYPTGPLAERSAKN